MGLLFLGACRAGAQTQTPAALEQRVADLEAYVNNTGRGTEGASRIAPGCGYMTATGAVIAGLVPYAFIARVKLWRRYDDALDAFGVHAVNGTLGTLLTGFLASSEVNPRLLAHLGGVVGMTLWIEQLKAAGATFLVAVVGTFVIGIIVQMAVGLRVDPEVETRGLDVSEHGEEGYAL